MGILHSSTRCFGSKKEDEEGESPSHHVLLQPRRNHSRSSERLPKMLIFGSSIYNVFKGLLRKFRFIFYFSIRPRKAADPVLPIQNPTSSIITEPLLVQTTLVSSSSCNNSSTKSTQESAHTNEQEFQCDHVGVISSDQQWMDDVIVSIPDLRCSLAYASASEEIMCSTVFLEENANAPRNVPFVEERVVVKSREREREEREEENVVKTKSVIVLDKEPLLVQTTLISSPGCNDSSAYSTLEKDHITEQELQWDNVGVLSSDQQWLEEKMDDVIVSIPDLGCSLAYASASEEMIRSAVFVEENANAARNVPVVEESVGMKSREREGEEKEVKMKIKSVVVGDVIVSIPDFTRSLAYASVSEEILPSTIFIKKNAPRNIPVVEESVGMKSRGRKGKEKVKIKRVVVVDEGRWIKHYNSRHRILLVGEGDFSFSACLATAFGSAASNIIATSFDTEAFLKKNYRKASSNIKKLRGRESKVMHEIDATKMVNHALLGQLKFDRIIFNFPYAGLNALKNLPRESQLRRHRRLVSLFLKNAREMISENGEIHISHKINSFHVEFNIESLASSHRLRLIEAVKFNCVDYPGYNTKCGFGGDNNFNFDPSKTYKFGLKRVQY